MDRDDLCYWTTGMGYWAYETLGKCCLEWEFDPPLGIRDLGCLSSSSQRHTHTHTHIQKKLIFIWPSLETEAERQLPSPPDTCTPTGLTSSRTVPLSWSPWSSRWPTLLLPLPAGSPSPAVSVYVRVCVCLCVPCCEHLLCGDFIVVAGGDDDNNSSS